jgi:ribosome-dependent ATPase
MQSGEVSLAIDIPEGFGRDLRRGRKPEVGVWVDGAMPYRGETIRGYMDGMHREYVRQMLREATGSYPAKVLEIQSRYRYNQDFKSIYAMVPAVIPLLLLLIPAILMALGVVREKELGSITNLYVTPVTRLEFLIGKQLPYIAVCMASYLLMMGEAVFVFGVPVKGSFAAMTLGALLYVTATTGLGLLMSTFTKTQIAALFGTAIVTMLPTIQFSGLTTPVEALEGGLLDRPGLSGDLFHPDLSRRLHQGLGFADLWQSLLALAAFIPLLTFASVALLKKQEK